MSDNEGMIITDEMDYRNAKAVLRSVAPDTLDEIYEILTSSAHEIELSEKEGKQRTLSKQVQNWFVSRGWNAEVPSCAVPDMRYDLVKDDVVIEIELGHQRLVFADFFEFMADFSKQFIPAAVMIVTGDPNKFGHNWHCSIESTRRKIESVKDVFFVPVLVIGVDP